jgi:CRISPR-associated protein Cas1
MVCLYLTEPHCTLRREVEALIVTRDPLAGGGNGREVLLRVPPHQLEVVVLMGDVHITADATHFCLDQGITVSWFTRNGRLRGRLVPALPRSADLRLRQYAAALDAGPRLVRARAVVVAKLHNAAGVLVDLRSNYPGHPALAAVDDLHDLATRAKAATGSETLLGLEGAGARRYFQALATAFRGDILFSSRQQRPPPDPANALLSLGYVLLGNQLAALLEARGLDPALGFFHELRPGRPSLALDLLEEFRHPVVDRFVLRACNLRIFRPEMFEEDPERPGGVRLTGASQKRFFTEWETFLVRPLREQGEDESLAVRPLLRRQVERLAADLRGGEPYRPLAYGGG